MEMNSIIDEIEKRKSALRVSELSEMLDISKRALYDMIKDGRLPALNICGSVRLDPKATAAWLRKRFTSNGCS